MAKHAVQPIDKVLGNTTTEVRIREIQDLDDGTSVFYTIGTCLDTPNAIKTELSKPEYQGRSVWLFDTFGGRRYHGLVTEGRIEAAEEIIEQYQEARSVLPVTDPKYSGRCDLDRETAKALIKVIDSKRDPLLFIGCVGCFIETRSYVAYGPHRFHLCRTCQKGA
jgi:hypothetical protein